MTFNEIYRALLSYDLPLADIKMIFDGYFHVEFDRLGIVGEEEYNGDIKDLLERVKEHYPVSYLVGYTDMAGLRIYLNKDTLIPRIETEDFVLNYLKPNYDLNNKKVLDLCTGSGFIALLIKKLYPTAEVYGSDLVVEALTMAKKNSIENHLPVEFLQSDYLKEINMTFDFIVSNPPYIEENSKDVFAPFEPKKALFSGVDGMDSYRNIFPDLESRLNENGYAFFELESTNSNKPYLLLKELYPNYKAQIIQDLYGRDRYLVIEKH